MTDLINQARSFATQANINIWLDWLTDHLAPEAFSIQRTEPVEEPSLHLIVYVTFTDRQDMIDSDTANAHLFYEPWNEPPPDP